MYILIENINFANQKEDKIKRISLEEKND